MSRQLTITISDTDLKVLKDELENANPEYGHPVATVEELVQVAVEVLVMGLRRPGSWEAEAARLVASVWRGWK